MVKFKGFSRLLSVFSSTYQGKFNFQGRLKTVLYIQVLFKPVRTLSLQENLLTIRTIISRAGSNNNQVKQFSTYVLVTIFHLINMHAPISIHVVLFVLFILHELLVFRQSAGTISI